MLLLCRGENMLGGLCRKCTAAYAMNKSFKLVMVRLANIESFQVQLAKVFSASCGNHAFLTSGFAYVR